MRWALLTFCVVVPCLLISIMLWRLLRLHKQVDEEQKKAEAANKEREQLEEYNRQLVELKMQMQQQLLQNTMDDNLSDRWNELKKEALSGIPAVDLVFQNIRSLCQAENIRCDYRVQKFPENVLPSGQWFSLVVNLLNNALEAARKCEEDQNRWISLETRTRINQFLIQVKNGKCLEEKPIENGFATTKKNAKEHGFGGKIIDRIVEEHQGFLQRKDEGETFVVLVMLRVEEIGK